jgi:hypothetical protein
LKLHTAKKQRFFLKKSSGLLLRILIQSLDENEVIKKGKIIQIRRNS